MKCAIHETTEAVARCVECGLSICDGCRVTIKGDSYCKKCIAVKMEGGEKPERSPELAALLSFVVAGTGQMYNGQIGKGLAILLTCWLVVPWVWGIFDAYSTAHKINNGKVTPRAAMGTAVVAIALAAMVFFVAFIVMLMAAIAIPNFIKARTTAMAKVQEAAYVCRTNLSAIDSGKRMWARDTGMSMDAMPTWDNLVPDYLIKRPECPSGGTYTIGSVGSSAKCSVRGHSVR